MFDIGLNLTSSQFAKDRDDVVARAFAAGVKGLLLTGTNLHESEQAQQLAQRYDRCWSTAGVHPHDSSQWTSESAQIIHRLAKTPKWWLSGNVGSISTAIFPPLPSRKSVYGATCLGGRA